MSKKHIKNSKGIPFGTAQGRQYLTGALFLFAILGGVWFFFSRDSNAPQAGGEDLTSVESVSHVHGLAVDAADASKLYIATHHGLFLLRNDTDLFRVGKGEDDFMGFSAHPADPSVFYSSGHPTRGGNLGVLKSEDQGKTWKKIASGIHGPVDFHAMTMSPANPQMLYGWYQNALQRSADGGIAWEVISASGLSNVITLAADSQDESLLYAGTTNDLFVSKDKGVSWSSFSEKFRSDAVIALASNPVQPQEMVVFSQNGGLARTKDGGAIWEKITGDFGNDMIIHLAWSKKDPAILYAATKESALYKSSDGGNVWQKIRE